MRRKPHIRLRSGTWEAVYPRTWLRREKLIIRSEYWPFVVADCRERA